MKAETGSQAPAGNMKKKNKNRNNKRKSDPSTLTAEEQERRRLQKEKRELALKLRSEGKEYKPSAKKTRPPKWEREALKSGAPRTSGSNRKDKGASDSRNKKGAPGEIAEPGSGKLVKPGEVEVIIIPLFWKQRENERQAITDAAMEVQKLYSAAKVQSFVDFSNKLNPGQKYRYWEERGVKLRVELGPKDLESSSCVFAVCTKAGEVAQKSSLKFGEELLLRTGEALGRGLTLEGSNYEPKPFDGPKEAPKGLHKSFNENDDDDDDDENDGVAPSNADDGGLAKERRSGDDLGDDFLLDDKSAEKKKKKGNMFRHK